MKCCYENEGNEGRRTKRNDFGKPFIRWQIVCGNFRQMIPAFGPNDFRQSCFFGINDLFAYCNNWCVDMPVERLRLMVRL